MADDTSTSLGPGGCYPSDFVGPLPEGGQYCNAPNTPTWFGSINAILNAGTKTVQQIRTTIDQYGGKTTPVVVAVQPSQHTGVALLILLVVAALVIWLLIKAKG